MTNPHITEEIIANHCSPPSQCTLPIIYYTWYPDLISPLSLLTCARNQQLLENIQIEELFVHYVDGQS